MAENCKVLSVGFRVKSGFAIAVVIEGPAASPRAVARYTVEMSDPKERWTRQPFHNRMFKTETDVDEIARRVKIVKRCAKKSVVELIERIRDAAVSGSRDVRVSAALVVGSVVDPATIGSPHMRAHANEGRLFRTVLEGALQSHGIDVDVIVEKTLAKKAGATLGRPVASINKVVAAFGETLGKPWRAEEKAAATAAWLILAS